MTIFFFLFFSVSKVLPFRDLRIGLFQRQNFIPETFAKPHCCVSQFLFLLQMLYLNRFPVSACVLTQTRTLPVTHAAKHTQLIRTPGPAHQGERMVPRRGGGGGRLVGGDEPGSSALSPVIHTQWVHSHTCLIAWPIGGGAH